MPDLSTLTNRDELGIWLNQQGLLGVGLEVGSLSGEYARQIMKHWQGRQLVLLDPWTTQPDDVYKEPVNHTNWDECLRSCKELAREYAPRVDLLRGYSPAEAARFPDGSLSFVYLDSNHSYECAIADIAAWWPKICSGGLFGAHDFRTDTTWPQNCRVEDAIREFAVRENLPIHYTPPCGSVWFIKP